MKSLCAIKQTRLAIVLRLSFSCLILIAHFLLSTPTQAEPGGVLEILAVNYPPYEFENPTDDMKGFDVEVTEEAFHRIGHPAKVLFRPWARAKKMVFEGGGFALLSCGQRKDRAQYLYYSDPISQVTWGYFYHQDYNGTLPETPQELRGHSVTVVRDYNQHKELDELGIENFPVNSDQTAVTMIANKRVNFAYIPQEAAAYQAKKLGLVDNVKYKVFNIKKLHVCFSRKWPDVKNLVTKFNQSLAELKADGTYASIHARYGIQSIPINPDPH